MLRKFVVAVVVAVLASSVFASKVTEGFEDKTVLKKWETEGDVVISSEQKHGGKNALFVPAAASATLRFSAENSFGAINIWVYDSCVNIKATTPGKNWNGPHFGLINSDDDKLAFLPLWRSYVKPHAFGVVFTAENQWFNQWSTGARRKAAGWMKVTFSFPDEKTLAVTFNDEKEAGSVAERLQYFNKGANGIIFNGGQDIGEKNETFFFDDLEIDVKASTKVN